MSYITKADEAEYAERSKTDPRDWMHGTVLECPMCGSIDVAKTGFDPHWRIEKRYECQACGAESYGLQKDERV